MALAIHLLGTFRVTRDGELVTAFGYDKVRALLAYLAMHPNQPLRREQIQALLWAEQSAAASQHSLSQALLKLRHALNDPARTAQILRAQRGVLEFRMGADDWLDAHALRELWRACETHVHDALETCDACLERLARAADLYRGVFLQEVLIGDSAAFEEWVIVEREQQRRLALRALEILTRAETGRGAYDRARQYAARHLELEPFDENAHRAMMVVLDQLGQRSAALAQYEHCRRMLAAEFGAEPAPETRVLYDRLRRADITPPHNLPLPLPALVGRTRELELIAQHLADPACRLVTLTGLGGIGKTTLALAAAQRALMDFADGVFVVSLVNVQSPAHILTACVNVLGIAAPDDAPLLEQLAAQLRAKQILLVLDNLDDVLGAPVLLAQLLDAAPHLKLLVTLREPLRVRAEWVLTLHGLDAPDACELFTQRAQRTVAGFAPSAADAQIIQQLCDYVRGSPLAIELAAGWASALPLRVLAEQIQTDLDVLTSPARDAPERQRSVRAIFEHTWERLPENERVVLRGLSVFQRPFRRSAAQAVAGATPFQLAALVSKALVQLRADERYELHPLWHAFLRERLDAQPQQAESVRARHAEFVDAQVRRGIENVARGKQIESRPEIQALYEEMMAALEWSAAHRQPDAVRRIVKGLYDDLAHRGEYARGIALFQDIARVMQAQPRPTNDERRALARVWACIGGLYVFRGAQETARSFLEQSQEVAREVGDADLEIQCFHSLSFSAFELGEPERARDLELHALELRRASKDELGIPAALATLAGIELYVGPLPQARAYYEQSLAHAHALGHTATFNNAFALNGLGVVMRRLGEPALARQYNQKALDISRGIGHQWSVADCLWELGLLAADAGEFLPAEKYLDEMAAIYHEIGKRSHVPHSLRARGWLEECRSDWDAARRNYQDALVGFEQTRQKLFAPLAGAALGRMLARQGEWDAAHAHLTRAQATFAAYAFQHGLALTRTGLGLVERGRDNRAAAHAHFLAALEHAQRGQEIFVGLGALAELTELWFEMGRVMPARRLCDFLLTHPATPQSVRARCAARIDQLGAAPLSPDAPPLETFGAAVTFARVAGDL